MTKKNWLPVVLLIVLAAVYVIWFTDWFKPKTIRIFSTIRQVHTRRHGTATEPELIFGVEPALIHLTEVKVVPLADFKKDPATLPIWHLVSDSNSAPVKNFFYGQGIHGMRSWISGAEPGLLDSNTVYRIFIKAGKAKGEKDFQISGTPSANATEENP